MEKKMQYLIVSYVPCLWPEEASEWNRELSNSLTAATISKLLDEKPSGEPKGVIWYKSEEGNLTPVLIVPNADEFLEHLMYWSENAPEEWFQYNWEADDASYRFTLTPKMEKVVARYGIQLQLQTGYPLPKDAKFSVIFKPIVFEGKRPGMQTTQKEMEIKLVDAELVEKYGIDKMIEHSRTVGVFPIVNGPYDGGN